MQVKRQQLEIDMELSLTKLKYLMATKVGRFAKKAKSKWTGSQRKLETRTLWKTEREFFKKGGII